jgi:hypothetical protein
MGKYTREAPVYATTPESAPYYFSRAWLPVQ